MLVQCTSTSGKAKSRQNWSMCMYNVVPGPKTRGGLSSLCAWVRVPETSPPTTHLHVHVYTCTCIYIHVPTCTCTCTLYTVFLQYMYMYNTYTNSTYMYFCYIYMCTCTYLFLLLNRVGISLLKKLALGGCEALAPPGDKYC